MKDYSKAHAILNKISLGWNLGNYLDAHDKKYVIGTNKNKSIKEVVNLWNNPIFNLKCFDTLKIKIIKKYKIIQKSLKFTAQQNVSSIN